jgi:hypothetical protein
MLCQDRCGMVRRLLLTMAIGAAASAAGNVGFLLLLHSMGAEVRVADPDPRSLGVHDVIPASIAPAPGAALAVAMLRRFARRPAAAFATVAVAVLAVSFAPVVTMDVPLSSQLALTAMHLWSAAAIALPLLRGIRAA